MRRYWQRKPLLIRSALQDFAPPIDRKRLFELARDPQAESRLITLSRGRRSLQHGPFRRLPSIQRAGWTLLIQGVDLLDDPARDLLSRFRFIPDARLDDLMVSFATDGGGVGPHVDSYDVFLLQAFGRRRWRVSRQRGLREADSPISNVEGFRASTEWILEAGDMLYLPPGIPHEGVALDSGMTYSIGFRAPDFMQLIEPWFSDYAERANLRGRYADPGAPSALHPAALPQTMTRRVHAELARQGPGRADTERFLLRHLSEPKATTVFEGPAKPLSITQFRSRVSTHGLRLDRKTRMLYANAAIGINGDIVVPSRDAIAKLRTLADQRSLSAQQMQGAGDSVRTLLHAWHGVGWIIVN